MFTTTGLFRSIPCPRADRTGEDRCSALNCIFSHDPEVLATLKKHPTISSGNADPVQSPSRSDKPIVKRRKLDPSESEQISTTTSPKLANAPSQVLDHKLSEPKILAKSQAAATGPQSLKRPISPPPKSASKAKAPTTPKVLVKPGEGLVPRMLIHPPAPHDKRCLYLRCIHDELKRLNGLIRSSSRPDKNALELDGRELITISNDEEEKLAKESSAVYPNHIKRRIGQLKKMTLEEWVEYLKTTIFSRGRKDDTQPKSQALKTGLTGEQERQVLRGHLLTPQAKLKQMGYIILPPTEEAIEESQTSDPLSKNWENCDRCKSRFQVFPERRAEDGALTTNGTCTYHWGRLRRPQRKKTDAITGSREPMYTCCGEAANTTGCSSAETHVYKIDEAAKMAWATRFIDTPVNTSPARMASGGRALAVTFDCEMGYTVYGLELIRLTAISWPENEEIMDILVQPRGPILDFNSRFSGVTADIFKSAIPWAEGMSLLPTRKEGQDSAISPLPIVSSPEAARQLLCSYITPDTPLIGHALENDLNSVRLCHANIVDTVALFPHPAGLPIRYSLKQLALVHLKRDIQTGGAAGHDSLEDARATGDLVRVKAGWKWTELEAKGLPV